MVLPVTQQGFVILLHQTVKPLTFIYEVNSWIGYGLCYVILSTIYYSNAWNVSQPVIISCTDHQVLSDQSKSFPMLSTSIFSSNGSIYEQSIVFGTTFQLNQTALDEVGLPHMTGSNVWVNITSNLAVGTVMTMEVFD